MSHNKLVFISLVFFLMPGYSWAIDYNNWITLVPDQLDGFKVSARVTELNKTTFYKKYVNNDQEIELTINYDSDSITAEATKSLMQVNMDNEYGIYKTFDIQGFKGVFLNDKNANSVNIMIILKGKTVLGLLTSGGKKMKYYIELVNKIDLKKIAATL